MRSVFARVDMDGDLRLDAGEVLCAVRALGLQATAAEAAAMVRLLDRDSDGRIDYDEFRRFVVMLPSVSERGRHTVVGCGPLQHACSCPSSVLASTGLLHSAVQQCSNVRSQGPLLSSPPVCRHPSHLRTHPCGVD